MAIDLEESVRARLTAYIAPNTARTTAEKQAFEEAVDAQVTYEKEIMAAGIPEGVASFTLGDFSAEMKAGAASYGYTQETLSTYAWALLYNAGLLRRGALPIARRF